MVLWTFYNLKSICKLLAWSMISDSIIRKCQLGSYCFDPIIHAFNVLVQLPKDRKYICVVTKHVLIKTLAIRKHKYEIDSKAPRKLLDMIQILHINAQSHRDKRRCCFIFRSSYKHKWCERISEQMRLMCNSAWLQKDDRLVKQHRVYTRPSPNNYWIDFIINIQSPALPVGGNIENVWKKWNKWRPVQILHTSNTSDTSNRSFVL